MYNSNSSKHPKLFYQCVFIFGMLLVFFYFYQTRISKIQLQYFFKTEPLPHGKNYTNWIIVTTISAPTKDIEKLAQIKGWQLLVVADKKTPNDWFFPGCIFLSVDHQKKLGYALARDLPYNSYTRKNIGYLYAIQHGARYIYDTDDDNHPTDDLANFHQEPTMSGLIYDDLGQDVTNPYSHFGQPSIWPRGYPLQSIATSANNTYKLGTFPTPAIQQGLVNGDPDVDAIFRLTRKQPHQVNFNITFDSQVPPLTLPRGVFAPFNSQNTFFAYGALWALYLPSSVAFRVTDIWRGYWAQKLLWFLGQRLAFFPPNAVQIRNAHNYLMDFRDEDQFYLQTTSLVHFLKNWTCPDVRFFACVSRLGHDMAAADFWKATDADLIDLWLSDLHNVGYDEPAMVDATDAGEFRRVYYSSNLPNLPVHHGWDDLSALCGDSTHLNDTSVPSRPSFTFDKLLLVIVFNFPFPKNIGVLEALYRDHFPNIIYCSQLDNYDYFLQEVRKGHIPLRVPNVSFINITSARGYFGYECAMRAIEMNYKNVDGYVILGDDVLFNFWNLRSIKDLSDVAHLESHRYRLINRTDTKVGWQWWEGDMGKSATDRALTEIESRAANDTDPSRRSLLRGYVENRGRAGLNMSKISICGSDVYHVSRSTSRMFLEVMKIFLKHRVFLELAVPSAIAGLQPGPISEEMKGIGLWGGNRGTPMKFLNETFHYLHPLKLSEVFRGGDFKENYCGKYIHNWMKNY